MLSTINFCYNDNVLYLHCLIGSYWPHIAVEQLKVCFHKWGSEFLIVFHLNSLIWLMAIVLNTAGLYQ